MARVNIVKQIKVNGNWVHRSPARAPQEALLRDQTVGVLDQVTQDIESLGRHRRTRSTSP